MAIRAAFPDLQSMPPPIDVSHLARQRNVVSIKELPLAVDGTISRTFEGEYFIELNQSHARTRMRFTCAHEIGHTFFMELDGQGTSDRMRVVDDDLESLNSNPYEESLCNMAAAEILMPHRPFARLASETGLSAQSIVTLARIFGSSLWATARRFVEVSRFSSIVALWEYQVSFEAFTTTWVAKSPQVEAKGRTFTVDKRVPAFKGFQEANGFRGRRWIPLGGPMDDYFVDAIVLKPSGPRRILTLITLEKDAEKLVTSRQQPLVETEQFEFPFGGT
jgi:Zn-dependent peptidase ImmA (M78 family)